MGIEMMSWLISMAFCLAVLALCYWKPGAGRITCGTFFFITAFIANGAICIIDPSLFVGLGKDSVLPLYRWFFTTVVAAQPLFWGLMAVVWEGSISLLLLFGRGRWVKVGLIMGIGFLIGILPFSYATLANAVFALAFQSLLTREFPTAAVARRAA